MKLVLSSLFTAVPAVANTAGVIFVFQVVFAIMGMQLYMGGLSSCTDPMLQTKFECSSAMPNSLTHSKYVGTDSAPVGTKRGTARTQCYGCKRLPWARLTLSALRCCSFT